MTEVARVPFRRRQLCRMLRRLREQARLTQDEAAVALRFSGSKMSRLETVQLPGYHELRAMLDLYGVIVNDWQPILDLWDRAKEKGWWHAYGLDDRGFVSIEADACRIRDYSFGLIPGLLQSEAYMRALFASSPRLTDAEAGNGVTVRQIRQRRLTEDPAFGLYAIFDEAALHRPALSATDKRDQLNLLVDRATLPNVSVQVIPLSIGLHAGQSGSFSVIGFSDRDEPDIAYVEHPFGSLHVEKAEEVRAARLKFDHLADVALDQQDTIELLKEMIAEP